MIDLYTDSSPNGFKITIALEEMGLPYRLHHVRIDLAEHRQPGFLALNPHGRIPVIVDPQTGITLFESAAILLYLAEKSGQLLPSEPTARWQTIKWLQFHSASVGPIMGQRVYFERFAKNKDTAVIERYRQLTQDLFTVLDNQLSYGQPWLAGEHYSIADIAQFGWTHIAKIIDFDFSQYQYLSAWYQRVALRPAVAKGITLPAPATDA